MLARLWLNFFKLGFNNMWIKNFRMFKLGFKEAEESRSNHQHPLDHRKVKGIPEKKKICFYFTDYAKDFNCMDHNKLWEILYR